MDFPWTVSKKSRAVYFVDIEFTRNAEWSQYVLLTSDRHHDNPHTDQKLEYEHLKDAQARQAPCLDFGDFFCAMQGKYDRRADKSDLRPEHQSGEYLDLLVSTAASDFEKYTDVLKIIGRGNHETAIQKHHETDLTTRLCERLSEKSGQTVHSAGYTGWVFFRL